MDGAIQRRLRCPVRADARLVRGANPRSVAASWTRARRRGGDRVRELDAVSAARAAFFPRTDAGQFVINLKSPSGTRIENTTEDVKKVEALVRRIVEPNDLELVVANIGVTPDFSAIYTSNAGPHAATVAGRR